MGNGVQDRDHTASSAPPSMLSKPAAFTAVAGVWTSADGAVRLELEADGRYQCGLAGWDRTMSGMYRVDGLTLQLRDYSGLRTTVHVLGGTLTIAGHELLRA